MQPLVTVKIKFIRWFKGVENLPVEHGCNRGVWITTYVLNQGQVIGQEEYSKLSTSKLELMFLPPKSVSHSTPWPQNYEDLEYLL
jgi:hypothetical protein